MHIHKIEGIEGIDAIEDFSRLDICQKNLHDRIFRQKNLHSENA